MTRDESIFALHYGRRYGTRAARFWGKISTILLVVEIVAGGSAFASFMAKYPAMGALAGLTIAVAAAINLGVSPKEKQIAANDLRHKFAKAIELAPNWDDATLSAKVRELQSTDATEIEALRNPVWRDVCEEIGRPPPRERVPISEFIASALA